MPSARKRVEILFPMDLYRRFQQKVEEEGCLSIAEKIRSLVIDYLGEKNPSKERTTKP